MQYALIRLQSGQLRIADLVFSDDDSLYRFVNPPEFPYIILSCYQWSTRMMLIPQGEDFSPADKFCCILMNQLQVDSDIDVAGYFFYQPSESPKFDIKQFRNSQDISDIQSTVSSINNLVFSVDGHLNQCEYILGEIRGDTIEIVSDTQNDVIPALVAIQANTAP